jgi:chromosome partitioning protein
LPGIVFDQSARGAQAYIQFGSEMVERIKTM